MTGYRKISAEKIFTGSSFAAAGTVIILDKENRITDLVDKAEAGDEIEFLNGIISPGFINTHCHIELSHMKGVIPQKTGLVEFVQSVMKNRGEALERKNEAMEAAKDELYKSGTSAIGDICNTADSASLKKQDDLYWHNFVEISGFVEAGAQKRFEDAEILQKQFQDELPAYPTTLSPHSPYSVSKKLFGMINESTAGQTITIHNQETEAETELYQKGSGNFLNLYKNFGIDISSFAHTGKSSFETWLPYLNKQQRIISVHNTFTQQSDIDSLSSTLNLFFCICPKANLYIENKLPPVEMLLKNNLQITLGTDSYASNTTLNVFEEIKTLHRHFPGIGIEAILQWATYNGAEALGIAENFGSIKKGMKPGLTLIDPAFQVSRRVV